MSSISSFIQKRLLCWQLFRENFAIQANRGCLIDVVGKTLSKKCKKIADDMKRKNFITMVDSIEQCLKKDHLQAMKIPFAFIEKYKTW